MKKNIYKTLGMAIPLSLILLSIYFMLPRAVKSITLNHDIITFDNIGEMKTIEISYLPRIAKKPEVSFISENSEVVKFEGNNLISISEGTTKIYAKINNSEIKSEPINVIVHDAIAENKRAAIPIINVINAIGEVTLDKQEQIVNANSLYDAAPDEVKQYVSNYAVLENATTCLNTLIYVNK